MAEARRVLVMPATEIARRDEKDRQDWQTRGVSGSVEATNGNEIALGGVDRSCKRLDGLPPLLLRHCEVQRRETSTLAAIEKGDQVRSRGVKSEDGSRVVAEEVVSGKFVSKLGQIIAANPQTREITIQDAISKSAVTIRVVADSKLKLTPDLAHMMARTQAAGGHGMRRMDMTSMLEELPSATFEDLKVGSGVMVSCAQGGSSDSITAITMLAKADLVVRMMTASGHGDGGADVEAMRKMHGMDGSHAPTC